jgi:hypothetical protein
MEVKRYKCTVSDRRGFKGQCMEQSSSGQWVEYQKYKRVVRELEALRAKVERCKG